VSHNSPFSSVARVLINIKILFLNPTCVGLRLGADFKCTSHLLVTFRRLKKERWFAFNQANLKFPEFHLVFQTNGIIIIQMDSSARFPHGCSGGNSCKFLFLEGITEMVKLCHLSFSLTWVLLSRKREHVIGETFTARPVVLKKSVSESFFDLTSVLARNNNQTMSLFSTSWDGGNVVWSINENWVILFEGNHTDKNEWIRIIPLLFQKSTQFNKMISTCFKK